MSTADARAVLAEYRARRGTATGPFARSDTATLILSAAAITVADLMDLRPEAVPLAMRRYRIARRWLEICATRDGIKNRELVAHIARAAKEGKPL